FLSVSHRLLQRSLCFFVAHFSSHHIFPLSLHDALPILYFLQFAGCLVGPEPLRVSFEGAFQFWSHRTLTVILGPRLAVWQLARMLPLRTARGPPAENPESARLTPRLGYPHHGRGRDRQDGHHDVPPPGSG